LHYGDFVRSIRHKKAVSRARVKLLSATILTRAAALRVSVARIRLVVDTWDSVQPRALFPVVVTNWLLFRLSPPDFENPNDKKLDEFMFLLRIKQASNKLALRPPRQFYPPANR
jgi:hypothetical protein